MVLVCNFPLAQYKTKLYNFGLPQARKEIKNLYIEGYISQNTTLNIQLLLDEDGFTQSFETSINGTADTDNIFGNFTYNTLGANPFGVEVFGSNDSQEGLRKFRVYLGKDFKASPFYNVQLVFTSQGENQQWEITNYSFFINQYDQPEATKLFKSFQLTQ